jgi:hypothetical protein
VKADLDGCFHERRVTVRVRDESRRFATELRA